MTRPRRLDTLPPLMHERKDDTPVLNWEAVGEAFDRHHRFVVTTHVNPDGDGLGAELGLWAYLKSRGKDGSNPQRGPASRAVRIPGPGGSVRGLRSGRARCGDRLERSRGRAGHLEVGAAGRSGCEAAHLERAQGLRRPSSLREQRDGRSLPGGSFGGRHRPARLRIDPTARTSGRPADGARLLCLHPDRHRFVPIRRTPTNVRTWRRGNC